MKREMLEFLLHASGVTPDGWFHLNQRAPSGHIVYGPKYVPIMDRPYMQGYRTHPELTRRSVFPYYAAGAFAAGTAVYLVSLPFMVATASYPEVAAPQYQSAMSGQMSGTDPNLLFGGKQGWDYFLKNFR